MNAQRKLIRNGRFIGAVSVVIAASFMGTATAQDTEPKYMLSAISDAAYGNKIIAGQYAEAIDKIKTSNRRSIDDYYAATNLCVAHVMTRDLDSAAKACDSAVMEVREKLASRTRRSSFSAEARAYEKYLAIALSNRGVLRAIKGEVDLARNDFRAAMELRVLIPAPKINLARLAGSGAPSA